MRRPNSMAAMMMALAMSGISDAAPRSSEKVAQPRKFTDQRKAEAAAKRARKNAKRSGR